MLKIDSPLHASSNHLSLEKKTKKQLMNFAGNPDEQGLKVMLLQHNITNVKQFDEFTTLLALLDYCCHLHENVSFVF